jgi:hypothetical protein
LDGRLHTDEAALTDEITITGVVTDEGVECPAVRTDAGDLFTLVGLSPPPKTGDRVEITGTPMAFSTCQQGVTIKVREMTPVANPAT